MFSYKALPVMIKDAELAYVESIANKNGVSMDDVVGAFIKFVRENQDIFGIEVNKDG